MDLLYQHERYDQMLEVFDTFSDKQTDFHGEKYPRLCTTLVFAACHKLVSLSDDLTTT